MIIDEIMTHTTPKSTNPSFTEQEQDDQGFMEILVVHDTDPEDLESIRSTLDTDTGNNCRL